MQSQHNRYTNKQVAQNWGIDLDSGAIAHYGQLVKLHDRIIQVSVGALALSLHF